MNNQQIIEKEIMKQADLICDEMMSTYKFSVVRVFGYTLAKIFKSLYEKVVVDETFFNKLREYKKENSGPLLFIPNHGSYIDFLIVSYILFTFKQNIPYIAAAEDFLNMFVVNHLLRYSGAFFLKRKTFEDNDLYKAIFSEYITQLLINDTNIEFFIEGTRSRTGKILQPKYGILGIAMDAVYDQRISDCTIVPLTINYEKVLEGETFPQEMLGEDKVKETLGRVFGAWNILQKNHGKIMIEFCDLISIKKYST